MEIRVWHRARERLLAEFADEVWSPAARSRPSWIAKKRSPWLSVPAPPCVASQGRRSASWTRPAASRSRTGASTNACTSPDMRP
jgi:hypothetical protein